MARARDEGRHDQPAVSRRRFVAGAAAASAATVGTGLALTAVGAPAQAASGELIGVSRVGATASDTSLVVAALPALPPGAVGGVVGLGSWSVLGGAPTLVPFPSGGLWGGTVLADLAVPLGASLSAVRIFCRTTTAMTWRVEDLNLVSRVSNLVGTEATSGSGNVFVDVVGLDHPAVDFHALSIVTNDATSAGSVVVGAQYWYVPVSFGYHPINPVRVYDSRAAGAVGTGPIVSGEVRTISVANAQDASAANVVPPGAQAVTFNLTVTATTGGGYLGVYPQGGTFSTSHINWTSAGQTIANAGNVALGGDRSVTVTAGGGGSTHFLVDVTGWYR